MTLHGDYMELMASLFADSPRLLLLVLLNIRPVEVGTGSTVEIALFKLLLSSDTPALETHTSGKQSPLQIMDSSGER